MTAIKTRAARDPARVSAEIYAQATLSEHFHARLQDHRESTGGRFKRRRFCACRRPGPAGARRDGRTNVRARNFVTTPVSQDTIRAAT